eukprot:465527_1
MAGRYSDTQSQMSNKTQYNPQPAKNNNYNTQSTKHKKNSYIQNAKNDAPPHINNNRHNKRNIKHTGKNKGIYQKSGRNSYYGKSRNNYSGQNTGYNKPYNKQSINNGSDQQHNRYDRNTGYNKQCDKQSINNGS